MLASSRSTSLRRGHAPVLASFAGLGCGPGHTFVSRTAPQRPPPFLGPSAPSEPVVVGASFVRPGDAPWALLDARWWRLNPDRPDYHPRTSAALLAGRGESRNMPRHDIDGKPRARADIGAYAAVP